MKLMAKQFIGETINNTLEGFEILDLFDEEEVLNFIKNNYKPEQIYDENILKECVKNLQI